MTPVNYASPTLAQCLVKALCSTEFPGCSSILYALGSYTGVQEIRPAQRGCMTYSWWTQLPYYLS